MPSRRRCRLLVAAATVALLAPVASARADGSAPLVPRGGVTLPAGSRDAGAVPAGTEVHAMVALKLRRPGALSTYAAAVSTPGSPEYHRYLSVAAFRHRFAPSAAAVHAVVARLRARGLRVGVPTANGLSIPVTATAGVTSDAFSTTIERFVAADGQRGYAPSAPARLGGRAGGVVEGIIGLDTVAPAAQVRVGRRVATDGVAARATSPVAGPQPCGAATAAATTSGSFTADQIAARYGLSNFYAAGDEGRGTMIALYELEPFSATDVASYQACMGTSASVSVESVDGGAGTGSGSGEAAMDVEDLIGLAPQASIRVYEGPATGIGAFATYAAIVSDDTASIVSTSWGLCESEQGIVAVTAESALFQEAAVQGQTIFTAAGDAGADDCGNGQPGVDDPASQPWVTAVGGTTARGPLDTVWNDAVGASGGGASQFWGRPAWQTADQPQSSVTCGAAGTACREIPDISADADPATGYTAYYGGAWRAIGGTSVSAPTVAALAALASASPACAGQRLGFLDPALYADAADIRDVTSGSNSFDGVTGAVAGPGYDMASGLGTPTAALGPALCGDAVTLATPAPQSWSTGRAASLGLSATSAKGAALSYSATGLPAGLSLNAATGRVSGTPTTAGHALVTVTALDADGAIASASFTATVTASASAGGSGGTGGSSAKTAGTIVVNRRIDFRGRVGHRLRFRVRARDAHHLGLRFAAAGLPRGMRIDRRTGVIWGTPRVAGRVTATIRITDAAGAWTTTTVRFRITRPAHARAAKAGHRTHRTHPRARSRRRDR